MSRHLRRAFASGAPLALAVWRGWLGFLHETELSVGAHDRIEGLQKIDKVICIGQSPLGRTLRTNHCTKLLDLVRDSFARLAGARMHGNTPGRSSFKVNGSELRR